MARTASSASSARTTVLIAHSEDPCAIAITLMRRSASAPNTLAATPGVLQTHASLLESVWGPDAPDVEALRVFVSQVRRKIEPDPRQPRVIGTDPGVGYRWLLEPMA